MQFRKTAALAIVLSVAACGTSLAQQIYKWTDENGTLHFSDVPVAGAEQVAIESRRTSQERVHDEIQALADARTRRAEESAIVPEGPSSEELRAEAEERQEKCDMYKERQWRFTNNRRIYRLDESGQRIYYDEEEMAAARARVDDLVNQYCN